jgi:lipopolysaccharide heptosyltransferase II
LTFIPSFIRLFRSLRRNRYRTVLDFQGLFRSALLSCCCRSRDIVGFAAPRESGARFFYHRKITINPSLRHAVERNLELTCAAFGLEPDPLEYDFPEHEESATLIGDMLTERGIADHHVRIGVVPGARWNSKRWPPEFFADVIRRVASGEPDARFILIGSGSDLPDAERILGLVPDLAVVNCVGETDLGELVELVRRCHAVFTNDSGPMHIAAALRVPVFALFGPTDPALCGPFGEGHHVFQSVADCAGCYLRDCRKKDFACHRTISPESVSDHILRFIRTVDERVES